MMKVCIIHSPALEFSSDQQRTKVDSKKFALVEIRILEEFTEYPTSRLQ